MKQFTYTRVFSDREGETHFETVRLPLSDAGTIGQLSEVVSVKGLRFRVSEPHYNFDWHPAPCRQFVVLLDGGVEIETSTGERRRFQEGEILLLEDTSGKGHRTRNLEARERRSLFIEVA